MHMSDSEANLARSVESWPLEAATPPPPALPKSLSRVREALRDAEATLEEAAAAAARTLEGVPVELFDTAMSVEVRLRRCVVRKPDASMCRTQSLMHRRVVTGGGGGGEGAAAARGVDECAAAADHGGGGGAQGGACQPGGAAPHRRALAADEPRHVRAHEPRFVRKGTTSRGRGGGGASGDGGGGGDGEQHVGRHRGGAFGEYLHPSEF
jgi:hypothetical protein